MNDRNVSIRVKGEGGDRNNDDNTLPTLKTRPTLIPFFNRLSFPSISFVAPLHPLPYFLSPVLQSSPFLPRSSFILFNLSLSLEVQSLPVLAWSLFILFSSPHEPRSPDWLKYPSRTVPHTHQHSITCTLTQPYCLALFALLLWVV